MAIITTEGNEYLSRLAPKCEFVQFYPKFIRRYHRFSLGKKSRWFAVMVKG